jgi:hypothetical protein
MSILLHLISARRPASVILTRATSSLRFPATGHSASLRSVRRRGEQFERAAAVGLADTFAAMGGHDPVPNLSVKSVRAAVLRASD